MVVDETFVVVAMVVRADILVVDVVDVEVVVDVVIFVVVDVSEGAKKYTVAARENARNKTSKSKTPMRTYSRIFTPPLNGLSSSFQVK
ncbi:MAG: hypothetical protein V1703_02880 [Candidatus Altiarchaeota archaeon]